MSKTFEATLKLIAVCLVAQLTPYVLPLWQQPQVVVESKQDILYALNFKCEVN